MTQDRVRFRAAIQEANTTPTHVITFAIPPTDQPGRDTTIGLDSPLPSITQQFSDNRRFILRLSQVQNVGLANKRRAEH